MTKPLIVACDQPGCGRRFRAHFDEVELPDGGVRQQFTCPRCDHVYPVARITARGLELREQIETARAAGDQQLLRDLLSQLQAEITRLAPRSRP